MSSTAEAVGMPPILHMGSCVDNSRILEAGTEVVLEGGLGDDLSKIPAVGVAPEWMSEKAVAIACYFVASGVDVVLGHPGGLRRGDPDRTGSFPHGVNQIDDKALNGRVSRVGRTAAGFQERAGIEKYVPDRHGL